MGLIDILFYTGATLGIEKLVERHNDDVVRRKREAIEAYRKENNYNWSRQLELHFKVTGNFGMALVEYLGYEYLSDQYYLDVHGFNQHRFSHAPPEGFHLFNKVMEVACQREGFNYQIRPDPKEREIVKRLDKELI